MTLSYIIVCVQYNYTCIPHNNTNITFSANKRYFSTLFRRLYKLTSKPASITYIYMCVYNLSIYPKNTKIQCVTY